VPQDDDVFVIMNQFLVQDVRNFYERVNRTRKLAAQLGMVMPPIYGYKTTERKPLKDADLKGTHLLAWEKKFFSNLTPDQSKVVNNLRWWLLIKDDCYYGSRSIRNQIPTLEKMLCDNLGEDHNLSQLLKGCQNGLQVPQVLRELADHMMSILGDTYTFDADATLRRINGHYPLMNAFGGVRALMQDDKVTPIWVDYIKLVDMIIWLRIRVAALRPRTKERRQRRNETELHPDSGQHLCRP
jgi:hypothetical protein